MKKTMLTLVLLCSLPPQVYASEHTNNGLKALKNQDFNTAKSWLLKAHQNAEQHPDLNYALGVTHYFLSDFVAAKHYFEANTNPERHYPSLYYLGKIHETTGNHPQAAALYETVLYQFDDLDAQSRADEALRHLHLKQALTPVGKKVTPSPTLIPFGVISADLNQVNGLVDITTEGQLEESTDTSASFMAAGGVYYFPKQLPLKLGISANAYKETYAAYSDYDSAALGVSTEIGNLGKSPWTLRLSYQDITIANQPFLQATTFHAKKKWQARLGLDHTLSAKHIRYDADPSYAQFDGSAQEMGYQFGSKNSDSLHWQITLTYRNEDKAGSLTTDSTDSDNNTFTSASKNYLQTKAKIEWNPNKTWQPSLSIHYRDMEYDEADVYFANESDTVTTHTIKKGTRIGAEAGLAYQLNKRWKLNASYQWLKTDLNLDTSDYESRTASMGMEYHF